MENISYECRVYESVEIDKTQNSCSKGLNNITAAKSSKYSRIDSL